ncbi:MAG: DUF3899 domain-containing protein [Clostridia bacterium]|nr:DUF3899 domain-containing protein [Clostridia bacterium]
MNPEKKRRLIGNSIFIGVCAGLIVMIADYYFRRMSYGGDMYLPEYEKLTDLQKWCGAYSSGFMTIGVVVFGVGLLTWISRTGVFDMLFYGFSVLKDRILFKKSNPTFYDYKLMKEEKRKGSHIQRSILIVGGAELILSIVLAVLFYV